MTPTTLAGEARLRRGISYVLLGIGAVLMLLPFVWMVSTSLKTPAQVVAQPPTWIPSPFAWGNYVEFWTSPPVPGGFMRFTWNTLFITVICMVGEVFSATIVAYGFARFRYPNAIGPGIYDIHSPRVPDADEMLRLLEKARAVIPAERLWVNPDCGLKTRGWAETETALRNMIEAARALRARAGERRLEIGERV